jgi:hypothetical protein
MDRIKYYVHSRNEIAVFKDIDGNIIKETTSPKGNLIIQLLEDTEFKIDEKTSDSVKNLLVCCCDYLTNNIDDYIKDNFRNIFNDDFIIRFERIENELCSVLYSTSIEKLLNYLVLMIYKEKIVYKKCVYCEKLFAPFYIRTKYCDRIISESGKRCKDIGYRLLKKASFESSSDEISMQEAIDWLHDKSGSQKK